MLIIFVMTLALSTESCSKFQQSKRQETQRRHQFERDKKKKDKEAEQAHTNAIQKHYDMQTPSAQREMRRNARLSQKSKEHKKEGFFKRLFSHGTKKGKSKRNTK